MNLDGRFAGTHDTEGLGGAKRQIDHPIGRCIGAPVVDANDDAAFAVAPAHFHQRAERKTAMRSRQLGRVVPFPARRSAPGKARRIIRRDAGLLPAGRRRKRTSVLRCRCPAVGRAGPAAPDSDGRYRAEVNDSFRSRCHLDEVTRTGGFGPFCGDRPYIEPICAFRPDPAGVRFSPRSASSRIVPPSAHARNESMPFSRHMPAMSFMTFRNRRCCD
jgi:hypothetical protein